MRIGIVGATGIVGRELVSILGDSSLKINELRLAASPASVAKAVQTHLGERAISELNPDFFGGLDFCFFCVSSLISKKWVPVAVSHGVISIDNSSAFRMYPDVPIVVPEVNGPLLSSHPPVVANPNCCVAQLTAALYPIAQQFGLEEVVVSSYQSVSGAGQQAVEQLNGEIYSFPDIPCLPGQFLFNVLPVIGKTDDQGHSFEESKIVQETRKVLNLPGLAISATAARVPVIRGHCLAVSLVTEVGVPAEDIRRCFASAENIVLMEDSNYPQPITVQNTNQVYVGRIRANCFHKPRSFSMWVVADNLRKGAAHNALKIAETWCNAK